MKNSRILLHFKLTVHIRNLPITRQNDILQMLGINVIPLTCYASEGSLPSVSDCARLISARTRAIVVVTPNNPVRYHYFILFSHLLELSNFKRQELYFPRGLLLSFFSVGKRMRDRSRRTETWFRRESWSHSSVPDIP